MKKSKIILVDWGYILHSSIYSYNSAIMNNRDFIMPSTFTAMTMLISALKRVGINPETDDRVLICCDDKSWRREVDRNYKSNREQIREQAKYVDWKKEFKNHSNLLDKIKVGTSFFVIRCQECEADDLIAEAVRFYKDRECIIISPDSDFYQLLIYDNVKIFSPHPKARRIPYRILSLDRENEKKLAYKSLMKKIEKEASDNLVTEIANEQDYDKRAKLVNLLELPDFISKRIIEKLKDLDGIVKEDYKLSVFSPSIQRRLKEIYNKESVITYEKCREKFERRRKK